MKNYDGFILKHFTPSPSPLSSGVDAFAQKYSKDEIYYAFPPFCLLFPVIKFIVEMKINCTLLFPKLNPIPVWYPFLLRHIESLKLIGCKGDKGVLLYPSKKGYIVDKHGLQFDLYAARFTENSCKANSMSVSMMEEIRPFNFVPSIFIGDSMIRFLTDNNINLKVCSVGGAKFLDMIPLLVDQLNTFSTFVVVLHVGTNNVNKVFVPEASQLDKAKRDL